MVSLTTQDHIAIMRKASDKPQLRDHLQNPTTSPQNSHEKQGLKNTSQKSLGGNGEM